MCVHPSPPDYEDQKLGSKDSFFPWHSDGPNFGYPITNGQVPFVEVKVGYYLTDLTLHNSGAICVVRGSHKMSPALIHKDGYEIAPDQIVEVNVRPGTAMLWRTALWHCLTPNLSNHARKCLYYYGYHYRWIRPADYIHQGSGSNRSLYTDSTAASRSSWEQAKTTIWEISPNVHPISRHWRPEADDIPLQAWAEARMSR